MNGMCWLDNGVVEDTNSGGVMVVGCILFKIATSLSQMQFPVAPVSSLKVIVLVDLMSNSCLY